MIDPQIEAEVAAILALGEQAGRNSPERDAYRHLAIELASNGATIEEATAEILAAICREQELHPERFPNTPTPTRLPSATTTAPAPKSGPTDEELAAESARQYKVLKNLTDAERDELRQAMFARVTFQGGRALASWSSPIC